MFDLDAGPFLALYFALLLLAIIAGFVIPRRLRPEGRAVQPGDFDAMAYLAGGRKRLAEALVTRLMAVGALAVEGGKAVLLGAPQSAATPAERSVLALQSPASWRQMTGAIRSDAEKIDERLVRDGLMMDSSEGLKLRFWQTLPFLLVFGLGTIRWELGLARDRPVGFLVTLIIITAILAVVRFAVLDRRTKGGAAVLARAQEASDRLRRAPTNEETGMAVALFGTAVLASSDLGGLHDLRRTNQDGGGGCSGGGSSSGGGSGCGGGGCGGCGGG